MTKAIQNWTVRTTQNGAASNVAFDNLSEVEAMEALSGEIDWAKKCGGGIVELFQFSVVVGEVERITNKLSYRTVVHPA